MKTKAMKTNNLPTTWSLTTLGEICSKPQYGWTTKANSEKGTVKLLRTTDITSGTVDWSTVPYCTEVPEELEKYLVKLGDIVISRAGSVGFSYLITNIEEAVFASYLIRFRPHEHINSKYVYYYLKSPDYWQAIGASKIGIAVPNVNATKLAQVAIPLAPPNEQKRIVAEIEKQFSRLDEAVAALKRIKANLKRYKASVLKAAVEGKLTEGWRRANPNVKSANELLKRILTERRRIWEEAELERMKSKGKEPEDDKWKKKYNTIPQPCSDEIEQLHKLPNKWAYVKLGELIDEPKYGTSKKCDYKTNGIGVLRIPNVINGFIDASDLKFAEFDEKEIQTYRLKEGDILTIRSNGSISLVGKCALVTKSDESYLYAGYLIKIKPFKEVVCSKYLLICFSSLMLRKQIESKAKSTSGVNNINSGELQSLIIPICRKEEQKEIVRIVNEKLSSIEYLELAIDSNLKRAERLRQSILKKAFSGKLVRNGSK